MIAVIQRAAAASVSVDGQIIASIDHGIVALVAVSRDDTSEDVSWMAGKLTQLRIFPAEGRNFDQDVRQAAGSILLVSNFTVAAATKKGRRPSLDAAAAPGVGQKYFDDLVVAVKLTGVPTETGRFGAHMLVQIQNDGPVTFIVDSKSDK